MRSEEHRGMLRQAKYNLRKGTLLHALVDFIIGMDWWHHRNYFKPGDRVRYNWKARICLSRMDFLNNTYTVKEILYRDKGNVSFVEEDGHSGASAFWLRKLYFWEK